LGKNLTGCPDGRDIKERTHRGRKHLCSEIVFCKKKYKLEKNEGEGNARISRKEVLGNGGFRMPDKVPAKKKKWPPLSRHGLVVERKVCVRFPNRRDDGAQHGANTFKLPNPLSQQKKNKRGDRANKGERQGQKQGVRFAGIKRVFPHKK